MKRILLTIGTALIYFLGMGGLMILNYFFTKSINGAIYYIGLVLMSVVIVYVFSLIWKKPEVIIDDAPDIETMKCMLDRKFHQCEVHRCSTYGCFNCGQYVKK